MAGLAVAGGGDDGDTAARLAPAATATATATAGGPATPAQPGGRAVWVANGCGSCHTLPAAGSSGFLGPELDQTLRGMPQAYIRRSIVDPNAEAAPGYEAGGMPEDYAARIGPAELDALVAFIARSAR